MPRVRSVVVSCHATQHQCVLSLSSSPLPSTLQRVSVLDTVFSSFIQILRCCLFPLVPAARHHYLAFENTDSCVNTDSCPNTNSWTQNGPKMDPKWTRNGPEMDPKWTRNGPEMDPKWTQNGPEMDPK